LGTVNARRLYPRFKEGRAVRKQETVRTLNRLIQTCRDSEEFCRALSQRAASALLASSLRERGEEWSRRGDELQALVLSVQGEPVTRGSPAGWLTRTRVRAGSAMAKRSDAGTLEDWQRLQQRAEHCYEEALESYLPERIRRTVSLQADRVHDRSGPIMSRRGQYALHAQGP
jgi:uncharacterized protein (TIGR02284 family)